VINYSSSFQVQVKDFPLLPGFPFFLCSLTRCLPPAPLKLLPYGAIQICLLLLLLLEGDLDSWCTRTAVRWRGIFSFCLILYSFVNIIHNKASRLHLVYMNLTLVCVRVGVCVSVCLFAYLITRERLRRSPPNRVPLGRPRGGFSAFWEGMGSRPENWHFSFLAAPTGEAWTVLGSL